MTVLDVYQARAKESAAEADLYRRKSRIFPWLRAGFFLTSIVFAIRVWAGELSASWMWFSGACMAAFVAAALRHQFLLRKKEDAELRDKINQNAILRVTDKWHEFPQKGESFVTPGHPYGHDLDLLGQGSLFQMINVTTTWFGQQTLGKWLLHRAPTEELLERQALVADMKDRLDLRQDLQREGLRIESDPQQADPEAFLQWVESPVLILEKAWLRWVSLIVPAWLVVAMGYWMAKVLPPWLAGAKNPGAFAPYSALWWFVPWLVVIVLFARFTKRCQGTFRSVIFHERAFSLYRALFARIDAEPAKGTPLADFQARLRHDGMAPHQAMKKLQTLIDLAEVRNSPILHLPLNLLLLWDIHCLFGMERWKRELRGEIRGWFTLLGELEACSSLAGLAYDHPDYTFPVFVDGKEGQIFEAKGLGHPLLPAASRVSNDATLHKERPLMLITGSNMSGKSTMLRSIGLNAVLAYAGGVVCAESLRLSPMQVGTSMRIADSLEQGISYFMAELKRIHRIVSLREEDTPLLFLLDEILHGTNTRERRIAAMSIVTLLLEAHTIGCVTTHDLELAEQCKTFGEKVQFTYFSDLIENDEMKFNYELQEGICPTTNALKLMKIVGIPLSEEFLD